MSKSRIASATAAAAVASSTGPFRDGQQIQVRLGDLGLAPENLRFDEPVDDDVAQMADTMTAAGVLIEPIVRPGRKTEQPFMALDGRRRRMALLLRLERGEIDEDYRVTCKLAVSKAAQAAALVLPNTERAPVHVAAVILAIGKFRKARMDTEAIAKALGYDRLDIRRLEALAGVHPKVLDAFRQGRLTLKQVRGFARISDQAQQAELAQTALDGHFHDYQLRNLVDAGQVTVEDPRFAFVGAGRYGAAGGRLTADLFGEMPDSVLDPDVLEAQWRARIAPFVAAFKDKGLAVYVGADAGFRAPDGFETLPYVYHGDLSPAQKTARALARERIEAGRDAVRGQALEDDAVLPLIQEVLAAFGDLAQAGLSRGELGAVLLSPAPALGVDATFYASPVMEADEDDGDEDEDAFNDDDERAPEPPEPAELITPRAVVTVEGVSHALHEARTDWATRGLIRDLADDPGAALTVLVAQLFKLLALKSHVYQGESALSLKAAGYCRGTLPPHPALDGEVRGRLDARRADYLASGLRPIAFVDSLAHGEKMALLAELVAVGLDLREARTSLVRHGARAEAAEIAALCGANLSVHWTPDAAFLAVHSKTQLLTMLAEMEVEDARVAGLKKDELVAFVAEAAAERRWTPSVLSWTVAATPQEAETSAADTPQGDELAADAPAAGEAAEPMPAPIAA
ncbi:chromosome partitioning protein ParB [Caulobacter rhizosphaerae]|uniref:chromosome partitioning protein ParB n=1 Tax=Caulobacter rhizosphaerae TaxID=2010972 RepID=UPI0019A6EE80|nr:chromosome partitioning protein ParB [Caulobacter rhizosphaerae]GGL36053.1 hypothetical protein GCM10010983_36440 [Caulobacter rhizosphaerae]